MLNEQTWKPMYYEQYMHPACTAPEQHMHSLEAMLARQFELILSVIFWYNTLSQLYQLFQKENHNK